MTAINVFRKRDRVSILTDTAGYEADGIVRMFYNKCIVLPHLRAAVAMRGSSLGGVLFASNFGGMFETFDALAEEGGAFGERLFEDNFELLARSGQTEVDIIIAGWSESRNRPASYMLSSWEGHGFEPWIFHEAPQCIAGPIPSEDAITAAGLDMDMDPDRIDAVSHGLKLMEAQRSEPMAMMGHEGGAKVYIVGGSVIHTEITAAGVSQRVIHRWADKLGEHIQPEPLQAHASQHLSRQQKRAMERDARKKRAA